MKEGTGLRIQFLKWLHMAVAVGKAELEGAVRVD